jgi:hypothetical protein
MLRLVERDFASEAARRYRRASLGSVMVMMVVVMTVCVREHGAGKHH